MCQILGYAFKHTHTVADLWDKSIEADDCQEVITNEVSYITRKPVYYISIWQIRLVWGFEDIFSEQRRFNFRAEWDLCQGWERKWGPRMCEGLDAIEEMLL